MEPKDASLSPAESQDGEPVTHRFQRLMEASYNDPDIRVEVGFRVTADQAYSEEVLHLLGAEVADQLMRQHVEGEMEMPNPQAPIHDEGIR